VASYTFEPATTEKANSDERDTVDEVVIAMTFKDLRKIVVTSSNQQQHPVMSLDDLKKGIPQATVN
jgi:hypothetical protein